MRPTSLLILLLWAVGTGAALADADGLDVERPASEPAEWKTLTEAVLLASLDSAHPASRALAGDLGEARARRLAVSVLEEPRFELSREAPEDAARETTWGVAWTPPIDGRRRRAIGVAQAGVDVELHRLEARLLALRSEVRDAYAEWAAGEVRVGLLAEHGERLEALARRMRSRAEAGEESRLAAERMELASRGSRFALAEARAAEAAGRERAAAWLVDGDLELSAMGSRLPELPAPPGELEVDPDATVGARPELRAARSEVARAESLERLSRRVVEAPEILVGWKSVDEGVAGDFDGPVFAIGWRVPLFDRRRADRLAAESALEAAAAGEEWATRRARGELVAALTAYRELRQSALAARRDLGGLDRMARSATASFDAGESTVTDLLNTLRSLLDARLAALDLYAAALEAHRRLEVAAGRPLISGDPS